MATTIKHTGKASSVPGGMAIAATASIITTIVLSALIANSLNTGNITWGEAGYLIMGMLFAASFIGAKCAFAAIKRQRIAISFMSGILYWGLLLCITALFFGGNFGAVWETAGIILAGSGTSALMIGSVAPKFRKKSGRVYR